jgi:hypothetical protein
VRQQGVRVIIAGKIRHRLKFHIVFALRQVVEEAVDYVHEVLVELRVLLRVPPTLAR